MNQKDLIVGLSQVYDEGRLREIDFIDLKYPSLLERLTPIPLSNEILDKLGFEETKTDKVLYLSYTGLTLLVLDSIADKEGKFYFSIKQDEQAIYMPVIRYLHELQQLIWVLFKKEVRL